MTQSVRNFSILGVISQSVTATAASQRIALSFQELEDIMLVNTHQSKTIFVRTGNGLVEADATAMPILAGEKGVYRRGNPSARSTHLAFFTDSGQADMLIVQGEGL